MIGEGEDDKNEEEENLQKESNEDTLENSKLSMVKISLAE